MEITTNWHSETGTFGIGMDYCPICRHRVTDRDPGGFEHPSGQRGHAMHRCWCGERATFRRPCDPELSEPRSCFADGRPALLVCTRHADRDGCEALPWLEMVDARLTGKDGQL